MTPSIPAITSRSLHRSGPFSFLIALLLLASWPGVAATQDDSAASPDAFGDGANPAEVAAAIDSLAEHAALVE